ncbi:hypothetical protein Vretimale_5153 [Volvox reticuliferus]|uniref:RRM domain-containing protein n=1 Tax=Volvox reticuliferus TaxID=1737510 RepID=A0A8J4G5E5_9CHLO|nr:hypothetical protein Vretimale_5153 [Volvox reticuliferus]
MDFTESWAQIHVHETENELSFMGGNTVKRARQVEDAESGGAEHPATSKRVRMEETEATAPFTEVAAATAGAEPHDAAGMQGEGNADAEMADQDDYEAPHDEDAGGAADGGQEHEAGPGPGTTKSQGQARRPHYTDKLTVFVRGLRPEVKDGELDGFLKSHVSEGLKEVRIMRDAQTGEARGFAYVECTSREALEKVVMLNGSTFHGKSLFVAESKPPGHNGGRGFGGRGHLGGRGRFGGPPFGRGDFSGRGRGRGQGSGGASATADGDNDTEMTEAGEGATAAGGGRGGRGGGRGGRHPGLGHPTGRGSMRTHVQMSGSVPPTALVPRSVQLGAGGSSGAPGGGQPMSNDDFRRMLLDGKK